MNPAKPLRIVRLEGNRGKRKLPKETEEVSFENGLPSMPEWLLPEAQSEWKRVSVVLTACHLVTHADAAMLALYCQTWARWMLAEKECRENAATIYARELRMVCREFGMTPSARARMVLPGEPVGDDMEGLLSNTK